MFAGETRVLPQRNAERLAVGDGKVLSAAVLDEREILLIANAAGDTMLHVWTRDGRSQRMKITVRQHDMGRLARDLHAFLDSIPNVRSRPLGDHLVIEGENISDADRDRIAEIVKRFPQVIDFTSRVGFDRMFAFDVHFVEISRNGLEDLGIDWTSQGKPLLGLDIVGDLYHDNRTGADLSRVLEDGDARTEISIDGQRLRPFSSRFSLVGSLVGRLNLLAQKGDAVILAQPRLAARNRGTANFLAGGEIPIATASATGTPNIEFKEYGIRLEIIEPVADDSGTIRARIKTEVSSLDRSVSVMGVPGLLSRRTETEFNLREGETLVLSGVINQEQANDVSAVPYLGRMPVLGSLFRSKRFQNRESELVVFLTPWSVKPGEIGSDPRATALRERAERRLAAPTPPDRGARPIHDPFGNIYAP
ncbi:MAG: type II and III secretion system protein [Thauera phenolivorans]|uniref:Type II and III secretion system protein n=2 Tax=Thauera phenolivorans TaxID=1792543 RepID=A0A7X7R7T4_9RHOO|nr:type II and III secretion system protein [Thauera phenolivorans]